MCMNFEKTEKYRDRKQTSACRGWVEVGMDHRGQDGTSWVMEIFYMIIIKAVSICQISSNRTLKTGEFYCTSITLK